MSIKMSEGWIVVKVPPTQLKHRLWGYSDLEVTTRTGMSAYFLKRFIEERYGRVEEIELFVGDPYCEYSKIRDDRVKLGTLLQTVGAKVKSEALVVEVHYDTVPHNSTEPLLLAL